ncbi:MAG: redoxin domain-containing protein [Planctomycetota bacterium]
MPAPPRRAVSLLVWVTAAISVGPVRAQTEPAAAEPSDVPEGHSMHGNVFNEGPRQRAYLMDGMNPNVHVPVSTENDTVRAFVDQGVVQLHGFWYFEAERSFRQAAAIEPALAIAYWGMAMANVNHPARARGFAWEAYRRREDASDWEQRHIDAIARFYDAEEDPTAKPEAKNGDDDSDDQGESEAESEAEGDDKGEEKEGAEGDDVAVDNDAKRPNGKPPEWEAPRGDEDKKRRQRYVDDLERIIYEHPDDVETKAFLVNQLWLDQRSGRRILSKQANQALLDQVFAKVPNHPAHHYAVHLWDQKDNADRVRNNAAQLGHSAPGIAHMWHMGGHIWAKLDRHTDAAWQQEASARTDHAHMMRDWVLPDQIHNYAHNNEWLCRSLRHIGRVQDSIDLATNMVELPRHPNYNLLDGSYNSATFGRRRLIETLTYYERWEQLEQLLGAMHLSPTGGMTPEKSIVYRAEHASLRAAAKFATGRGDGYAAEARELESLLAEARRQRADAVDEAEDEALDREAKRDELEQEMKTASDGKTRVVRRVRGRLRAVQGFAALDSEDYDQAFDLLDDNRDSPLPPTHLARTYLRAGRAEDAHKTAKEASKAGRAPGMATYAHVLWELSRADQDVDLGKLDAAELRDEAKKTFEELRALSSQFDLEERPFARLALLAGELGHPPDWRVAAQPEDDIGARPALADLGPFRWAPMEAPTWTLPTPSGRDISLSDYRGKPVIAVFFLGFGCAHCVEQLQALEPRSEEFKEAGIEIVTVGTEMVADNPYSFPITGDPQLTVFKQWRCFDDFESTALHGTFLIDGDGRIRWLDISYEPFMDIDFLLEESQRLLSLAADRSSSTTAEASLPRASSGDAQH